MLVLRAGDSRWQRGQAEGADSRRFAGRNQRGLRKRACSIKPFATHGTPARSSFRAERKRKPPNQRVRRPSFPLLCWWLCLAAMPKQYQAVLGGTKTRAQKPVAVIPTLSRSYAEVSFQLTSVWSSASTVLPPNPAACLRVGVWGKPWDKYANYFETASPQFRFCPGGKNGKVLRP